MRKEYQCYSEHSGNFYFYFDSDYYINILLTFYDKIRLIVWSPGKSKYYTLCQSIISSFRKGMDSRIRYLSCLSQGDRYSQRPWTEATNLLPKFRENEVMEAARILHIAKFTRSKLKGSTFLTSLPSSLVSVPLHLL